MTMTAAEQLLIELVNRARLDPLGEAARLGIDLNQGLAPGRLDGTAKQVLAPSAFLDLAAERHSQWMIDRDIFSHTGVDGSNPAKRMTDANYVFSGSWSWAENISWTGSTGSIDAVAAIRQQHDSLFRSAGHRTNILDGFQREIGAAQVLGRFTHTDGNTYNASMVTEKFAKSGDAVFITGVAYTDRDKDAFYTPGEATAGVRFAVGSASATTAAAGGYAVKLAGASATPVTVTVTLGSTVSTVKIDTSAGNVKLDVVDGARFLASADLTLVTGIAKATLLGVAALDLTGNSAANELVGNAGSNVINGAGGNDRLIGGAGGDRLDGSSGTDTASYQTAAAGVTASLTTPAGNTGDAAGDSYVSIENLIGTAFADRLSGNSGANTINGGRGVDQIFGLGGDDRLFGDDGNDRLEGGDGNDGLAGGANNDVLVGGAGADRLYGEAGRDAFVFDQKPIAGVVDTLFDYTTAWDRIHLDDADFAGLTNANLPTAFHLGTRAADPGDRLIYDRATGNLSFDADGTGSGAAIVFANLATKPELTAADFLII